MSCDGAVVLDYGELELSPKPAIDCQRGMMTSGKGNVQRRLRAMYNNPSLELVLSHHFFTPVFTQCQKVSVQVARPTKTSSRNVNFVGSSANDMLFCLSIV